MDKNRPFMHYSLAGGTQLLFPDKVERLKEAVVVADHKPQAAASHKVTPTTAPAVMC